MKLALTLLVLALALVGGVACGPEQPYCQDRHTTCEKARQDEIAKEKARLAALSDVNNPQLDAGTTVIDAESSE